MQIRQQVRGYILANCLFSDDENALDDNVSLIQTGVIDSIGVLELITFLQEQWAIEIADEEMIPDNLGSVASIVAFVERKRNEAALATS